MEEGERVEDEEETGEAGGDAIFEGWRTLGAWMVKLGGRRQKIGQPGSCPSTAELGKWTASCHPPAPDFQLAGSALNCRDTSAFAPLTLIKARLPATHKPRQMRTG